MMLECNLKLVISVLLLANVSKSTYKSVHGTKLCTVADGIHYYRLGHLLAGQINKRILPVT